MSQLQRMRQRSIKMKQREQPLIVLFSWDILVTRLVVAIESILDICANIK